MGRNFSDVVPSGLYGCLELWSSLGDGFDVVGQDVRSAIQVAGKLQLELFGPVAVARCRALQLIRQPKGCSGRWLSCCL